MGFKRLAQGYYTRWVSDNDDGLTDDDLIFALELMRHAGYELVVFYDRTAGFEPAEWLSWLRDGRRLFFMLYRTGGTPLAAAWLTEPTKTGRQAFAHFCTFDTGEYREYVEGGRLLLRFVGEATGILQAVGVTPGCYGHALKLAYDLGFKKLTVLKKAIHLRGKDRDAVLSVNTLPELEV